MKSNTPQSDAWQRTASRLFETLSDSIEQRAQQLQDMILVIPHDHPMSRKAKELLAGLNRHQIMQRELSFPA